MLDSRLDGLENVRIDLDTAVSTISKNRAATAQALDKNAWLQAEVGRLLSEVALAENQLE